MGSPLAAFDSFNIRRIEPSVSGFMRLQDSDPVRADSVNMLYMIGAPGSSQPQIIQPFTGMVDLSSALDPTRKGDAFVDLAQIAKTGIAEQNMFGAGTISVVRANRATQSSLYIKNGATQLIQVLTGDYGSHTRRSRAIVEAGSILANSKKVTLFDDASNRRFIGDNLGVVLQVQYIGNAATAVMNVIRESSRISYTAQPADGDKLDVTSSDGITRFEFDNDNNIGAVPDGYLDSIKITIGASADDTFAALATAIAANVPGITTDPDATNGNGGVLGTVLCTGVEDGVVVAIVTGLHMTATALGNPANLRVTLATGGGAATDGSEGLDIPLSSLSYKNIGQLAAFIASQNGYEASVKTPYANKNIPSNQLDVVANLSITAVKQLTAYCAAIADFINNNTQGKYTATILAYNEPDEAATALPFTGGTTPVMTIGDISDALDLIGAQSERGGIIFVDSEDAAVHALVGAFCQEQRTAGKWFRAFLGTTGGGTLDSYEAEAAALNFSRVRLAWQRMGKFVTDGAIEYQSPVYTAAAVAGACAGNRPYDETLTMKAFHFAAMHPDDERALAVRETLEDSGLIVFKNELGIIRLAFGLTTSRDPDHRMARIISEIDTLDEIDANVRAAFSSFRGKWVTAQTGATVVMVLTRVLDEYVARNAIIKGFGPNGEARRAFEIRSFALEAGILTVIYDIFIGGELSQVNLRGSAAYQRLQGSGGLETLKVAVEVI